MMRCPRCSGTGERELLWPHGGESATACDVCDGRGEVAEPVVAGEERARSPLLDRVVRFRRTDDPDAPYEAEVDGARWRVALVGDAVPFHALYIDNVEALRFDAWPGAWERP
jgi:hypothetical protein